MRIMTSLGFCLGAVRAATENYNYSFYLGGLMFLIGAAFHLLLHLPCIKRKGLEELTTTEIQMPETQNKPVAV